MRAPGRHAGAVAWPTGVPPRQWLYWQVSCLVTVMNDITRDATMLNETTSENRQARITEDEAVLEQQMAELDLSNDTRRFLRNLHLAEKQLNDAFNKSRQGGELEERVSQVYRDLYGAGGTVRIPRQENAGSSGDIPGMGRRRFD